MPFKSFLCQFSIASRGEICASIDFLVMPNPSAKKTSQKEAYISPVVHNNGSILKAQFHVKGSFMLVSVEISSGLSTQRVHVVVQC